MQKKRVCFFIYFIVCSFFSGIRLRSCTRLRRTTSSSYIWGITTDGIRFEYTEPGDWVSFSIYDAPGGNLLWEGSKATDETGFTAFSIWDHHIDLIPGYHVVVSDSYITKELLLEDISLELVDPDENILEGTAEPGRSVWAVVDNFDNDFCGTNIEADESGNWFVDFDDYGCDFTSDSLTYVQAMDDGDDTTEAIMDFIQGSHDYDKDDVPNWACNAGGWAVDTDDRNRDLDIRILSDGVELYYTTASNPQDLPGVCGDDGTCGYFVELWEKIEPYETHEILVEAFDLESQEWYPLENSPRSLTCRTQDSYYFDQGTGETVQVTELRDTNEFNPSWSPSGRQVAYDVVTLWDTQIGINIINLKTGQTDPLVGAEGGNDAIWSPNGKSIVFDRQEGEIFNLYMVPSTGGKAQLLRQDAASADFSPNGKRLVFQQSSDGSLRTMPMDKKGKETEKI